MGCSHTILPEPIRRPAEHQPAFRKKTEHKTHGLPVHLLYGGQAYLPHGLLQRMFF